MKKLSIKKSVEVNNETLKTWEIIGPNFLNISEWGRGINKSWKNDTVEVKFEGAPAGGRYCDVDGFGKFDERIIHYSDLNKEISWNATGDKLPGFVSNLQNELSVQPGPNNTSIITSHLSADLKGIQGFFLGGIMKKNFSKLIDGFLFDWKTYAETGKVSARKQKELSRKS